MVRLIALLLSLCISSVLCKHHGRGGNDDISNIVLSLTGDLNFMTVSFMTTDAPAAAAVKYWVDSQYPSQVKAESSDTLSFTKPEKKGKDEETVYITSLSLPVLKRGQLHSYVITADIDNPSWTSTYTFLPLPAGDDYAIDLALFGDLGTYGHTMVQTEYAGALPNWAKSRKIDAVFHYGDIAYDLASKKGTYADIFMQNIMNVSSIVPYQVGIGNHEYYKTYSMQYYEAYFKGQTPLGKGSNSELPLHWWSMDLGKAHFVMLNSEVYCEESENIDKMFTWVENDLKQARAANPNNWLIVMMHRQMYDGNNSTFSSKLLRLGLQCKEDGSGCDFTTACTSGKNCKYGLEDLFIKYKVDLVFGGHKHYYTRNFPVGKNLVYENQNTNLYTNPQNPVYILSGAAGTETSPPGEVSEGHGHDHFSRSLSAAPRPGIYKGGARANPAAFHSTDHSWTHMVLHNQTHLYLEQITVKEGTPMDSFWIVKNGNVPKWTTTLEFTLDEDAEPTCDS